MAHEINAKGGVVVSAEDFELITKFKTLLSLYDTGKPDTGETSVVERDSKKEVGPLLSAIGGNSGDYDLVSVGSDAKSQGSFDKVSWADEVEYEETLNSGSVTGLEPVSAHVRNTLSFGFGDPDLSVVSKPQGVMSSHIRTNNAKGLRALLRDYDIKLPKAAAYHIALVTHTAATVPVVFNRGREKLKTMAVLGDGALLCAVVAHAIGKGSSLESAQHLRSTVLTDREMSRRFAQSRFADFISVGGGVSLADSKTGATALEAIVGVVAYYRSPSDVIKLAVAFSLIKLD